MPFSASSALFLPVSASEMRHAQRLDVDLVPLGDDRTPVRVRVLERLLEDDELGVLLTMSGVVHASSCASARRPAWSPPCPAAWRSATASAGSRPRGSWRSSGSPGPGRPTAMRACTPLGCSAQLTLPTTLLRAGSLTDAGERGGVEVHRRLALQERGVGLALAVAGDAGRAGGHHLLQELQRLDADLSLKRGFHWSSNTLPPSGFRCSSQACTHWWPAWPREVSAPMPSLSLIDAQQLGELVVVLRRLQVVLGEDVAAVGEHRGLGAVGQCRRAWRRGPAR